MKRALTASEIRAVEAMAASEYGIPIPVLMENAGAALAEAALKEASATARFFVLCGIGNNGGDGLVAARKLRALGHRVHVEQIGEPSKLSPEASRTLKALKTVGLAPGPFSQNPAPGDVVIDALFGTGLRRAPEHAAAEAIGRIKRWREEGARVVSADLPSGLPSDGQPPYMPCVEADVTVTFGALKLSQLSAAGASVCGRIEVVAIGFPPPESWPVEKTTPQTFLLDEQDARGALPPRPLSANSNKGSFGHVLIVAGSPGKSGAATLCSRAAIHSGVGLCTLASRSGVVDTAIGHTPELMGAPLGTPNGIEPALGRRDTDALVAALEKKSAWVVGPGIPRGEDTRALLLELVARTTIPCVLDADALNAVADHVQDIRRAAGPLVLTPHPGEMARLMKTDVAAVQADRFGMARALAASTGAIVVLKGARTIVASSDGRCFVNPTGNPGMATGGTGDVLAGICGGLLAQKLPVLEAVCAAVYIHGMAGDFAAEAKGMLGLSATDVINGLAQVWTRWQR